MKKSVYVGLSGGVDSAVSASLLKREGYNVTGVFIKIWQPEFIECTWEKDRIDAMRVAVALDIPFREIDLSAAYKEKVIEHMTSSYKRGVTPNPDVACNERIKFGSFYDWARGEGADHVATGHYARIDLFNGAPALMRGADRGKDQSYFLYRIAREHLPHILFPVGALQKSEVRALAKKLQLPVAHKRDSQGLCFVGDVSMRDFLRRYIAVQEGAVHSIDGRIIGVHEGAALYTVGQRHGFRITSAQDATKPHYVVSVDAESNIVVVSDVLADTQTDRIRLDTPHWLADVALPMPVLAQSRYREQPIEATIAMQDGKVHAQLSRPHTVSRGQSFVMYHDDVCIGGATIL